MTKKPITEKERSLFIIACKNNGIVVSQNPQKRIGTATIIVGGENISVSKSLIVKKVRNKNTTRKNKSVKT